MKRSDIKAGVVYAIKNSYGPPSPVVFLEDCAAGLYGRDNYGRGAPRKLAENTYTKARRGRGFGESSRGYAALVVGYSPDRDRNYAFGQMRASDPAAELVKFLADEKPTGSALRFEIVTSLNQIGGLYKDELAEHEARQKADREHRQREQEADSVARARADEACDKLAAFGADSTDRAMNYGDGNGWVRMRIEDAEKLIALLEAAES